MNALKTGLITAAALACSFGVKAAETNEVQEAESCPLSVEVSVDVLSDYVWRGTICNDNPVWQPSVTLGYDLEDFGALSANVWMTYDLTHKRGTDNNSRRAMGLQEIDYTAAWSRDFGPVGVELGHIWYTYPVNNGSSDQEAYAAVCFNNDFVTPSAAAYWNYLDSCESDVSSVYFNFGLEREFAITDAIAVTPHASIAFADNAYTEGAGTEFTDSTVGVSASYAVTDWLSFSAQLNYTWIPSRTLRRGGWMAEDKDQLLWGGVNATLSF